MVRNILARKDLMHEKSYDISQLHYFYSMADSIIKALPSNMSREETLTQNFLELVSKNYHECRKVTEYALRLGLTPGYLSSIVKTITQKVPQNGLMNM